MATLQCCLLIKEIVVCYRICISLLFSRCCIISSTFFSCILNYNISFSIGCKNIMLYTFLKLWRYIFKNFKCLFNSLIVINNESRVKYSQSCKILKLFIEIIYHVFCLVIFDLIGLGMQRKISSIILVSIYLHYL